MGIQECSGGSSLERRMYQHCIHIKDVDDVERESCLEKDAQYVVLQLFTWSVMKEKVQRMECRELKSSTLENDFLCAKNEKESRLFLFVFDRVIRKEQNK